MKKMVKSAYRFADLYTGDEFENGPYQEIFRVSSNWGQAYRLDSNSKAYGSPVNFADNARVEPLNKRKVSAQKIGAFKRLAREEETTYRELQTEYRRIVHLTSPSVYSDRKPITDLRNQPPENIINALKRAGLIVHHQGADYVAGYSNELLF